MTAGPAKPKRKSPKPVRKRGPGAPRKRAAAMEGVRLILSGDKRTVLDAALATVHLEPGNQHLVKIPRKEIVGHPTFLRHKRRIFEELRRYKLRRGTIWSIWAYNAYLKRLYYQEPYRGHEYKKWCDEFAATVRSKIRQAIARNEPIEELEWFLSKIELSDHVRRHRHC